MASLLATHGVADAVLLSEISEDAFVANLQTRFAADLPYTFIGEVLVSVNPYRALPLYDADMVAAYKNRAIYEKEPHVFSIANAAYTAMRRNGRDTCVVISGESGAGKTEASKHFLRFVAGVSTARQRAEIEGVKDMLLQSNPLLEAFGNATTTRNDNSSRFGKYFDVHYNFKGDPVGGHIQNYLLEKSRVVAQQAGERNFHIFYQLLRGAPDELLASLHLSRDLAAYPYLNHAEASANLDDKSDWAQLRTAMEHVGLSANTQTSLLKAVAAVLHLGRVSFVAKGADHCSVAPESPLAHIAELLGTDAAAIEKALTVRVRAAKGELIESPQSVAAATYARDALAKALYDRCFTWLVGAVNAAIAPPPHKAADGPVPPQTLLGVLDIYGFEILAGNGFDQFCINYCNEKLQQLFIELVLKQEQAEYAREEITWVEVSYFDNRVICELIENPKTGILAVLDDECARPNGTDSSFLAHLDKTMAGEQRYSSLQKDATDKACRRGLDFRIRHFAGDVVYTVTDFCDRNTDQFFHDLKRMLYQCTLHGLPEMWADGAGSLLDVHKNPLSAGALFKQSMSALVNTLQAKDPYYVRCIKPNNKKAGGEWDNTLCVHQVRYLGLMENLRVRRAGYCHRQLYPTFVTRYKMLSKPTWPVYRGDMRSGARCIIEALDMTHEVAFGKTKLFVKDPKTLYQLEAAREARLHFVVAKIQAGWRGVLARRRVARIRAVYKIVAFYYRSQLRRLVHALTTTFVAVAQRRDLGKNVAWPPAPKQLAPGLELIKRIWRTWWARKVLKRYNEEQTADLQLKVVAYDVLQGRKPNWGYQLKWEGNYLAKTPDAVKFGAAVTALFEKHGDHKVHFSAHVLKLNHKGKQDERVVVVSDKHVYRLDGKKFTATKPPIPLTAIAGFAMSGGTDQALVIKLPGDDLVITLRGQIAVSELVAVVARLLGDKELTIEIDSKVEMTRRSASKSLTFEQASAADVKTQFVKAPSGFALVTRRASGLQFLTAQDMAEKRRSRLAPVAE